MCEQRGRSADKPLNSKSSSSSSSQTIKTSSLASGIRISWQSKKPLPTKSEWKTKSQCGGRRKSGERPFLSRWRRMPSTKRKKYGWKPSWKPKIFATISISFSRRTISSSKSSSRAARTSTPCIWPKPGMHSSTCRTSRKPSSPLRNPPCCSRGPSFSANMGLECFSGGSRPTFLPRLSYGKPLGAQSAGWCLTRLAFSTESSWMKTWEKL